MAKLGIGPYIPDSTIPRASPFDAPPVTGRFKGFTTQVKQTLFNAPTSSFLAWERGKALEQDNPGTFLTSAQWKNSSFFRPQVPGLPPLSFPNGVDSNRAKMAADRYDVKAERQGFINNMQPGFLSGGTRFVGGAIGFLLDPVNAATVAATTIDPALAEVLIGTIGTKVGLTAEAIARGGIGVRAARAALRAPLGAFEGAVTFTPDAVAQYKANNFFGEHTSIAEPLMEIGAGAAFGGFIRGVGGFGKVIEPEANEMAKQTAAAQLLRGKSSSVMPLIVNGYKDARDLEQPVNPELVSKVNDSLKDRQTQIEDQISQQSEKVNKLSEKPLVTKRPTSGDTLVQRINKVLSISENKRSPRQTNLLTRESHLEEVQRAQQISQIAPSSRTQAENEFTNKFNTPAGEKELVQNRLIKNQIDAQNAEQQLASKENETPVSLDRVKTNLNIAKHQERMAQNRLNELNKQPSFSAPLKDAHVKLFQLTHDRNILRELINEHELSLKMQEEGGEAVQLADLKFTSDIINSIRGESAFVQANADRLRDLLAEIPEGDKQAFDISLERNLAAVKELLNNKQLTSAQKEMFEAAQAAEKDTGFLTRGLKKMAQCLLKE